MLDNRLKQCTDREVGNLLILVQQRFTSSSQNLPSASTPGAGFTKREGICRK